MRRAERVEVLFDEKSRHDFVTGFRKRKDKRRKKASKELELRQKEERRLGRAERREKEFEAAGGREAFRLALSKTLREDSEPVLEEAEEYEDKFTKEAFGADSVFVSTTFGLANTRDETEDALEVLVGSRKRKRAASDEEGEEEEEEEDTGKSKKHKKSAYYNQSSGRGADNADDSDDSSDAGGRGGGSRGGGGSGGKTKAPKIRSKGRGAGHGGGKKSKFVGGKGVKGGGNKTKQTKTKRERHGVKGKGGSSTNSTR